MNNNNDILSRLNHRDGMTVPEGYFEDFATRMQAQLPARPELSVDASQTVLRTPWQRVRPYVYMAAMFAGVWCMLKMFTLMSTADSLPLESNPVVAEALDNETFVNDYVISDVNQWDLYDELMDEGIDPAALGDSIPEADFAL